MDADQTPLWPEMPSQDFNVLLLQGLRREESLVSEAISDFARQHHREALADRIRQNRTALDTVAQAASCYPSPIYTQTLGQRQRNIQTLIERLTRQNTFSIELVIPTRGLLGHTLCMARLNFFRMLRHCLAEMLDIEEHNAFLIEKIGIVDEYVSDCIATRATEEILKSIICREKAPEIVRERAAYLVLRLWHNASSKRLGDLIPILEATWGARRRARVQLGTLMGASEILNLLIEGCDSRFLDFLTRETCSEAEAAALREFLFGLSHEELQLLEEEALGGIISADEIMRRADEKHQIDTSGLFQAGDEAERFFLFFMKRHLMATHREELDIPGPKQTAEEYVVSNLLATEWEKLGLESHH